MPCWDDCRPTEFGNDMDWMSIVAKQVPESPGKGQVTTAWAPICACMAGLWMSCQGVGCKYLHSSMHPPSPNPRIHCPNPPSGSSSGFSLGRLCWVEEPGEAVVWPRVLCSPAEAPCDLLVSEREASCSKKHADDVTEATNCYQKGHNRATSYLEQLLATPIWTEFKKKYVSVVSLPPFTFLIFFLVVFLNLKHFKDCFLVFSFRQMNNRTL